MVRQLAARELVAKDKCLVRAGGKGAFKGLESCLGILVCDGTSNAKHFWEAAFLITSKKTKAFDEHFFNIQTQLENEVDATLNNEQDDASDFVF